MVIPLQALKNNKEVDTADCEVSVRRFASYGLFTMAGFDVDKDGDKCHRWYSYCSKYIPEYKVDIR